MSFINEYLFSIEGYGELSDFLYSMGFGKRTLIVILGLSVVLYILRRKRKHYPKKDGTYLANLILFPLLCLIETAYIIAMGNNSLWFCEPDSVGWLLTVVNYILLVVFFHNQFFCFGKILGDVQCYSAAIFSWKGGLISWMAAVGIGTLCAVLLPVAIPVVAILFLLAQSVQIFIVTEKVLLRAGLWHVILCCFIYLSGIAATSLILLQSWILMLVFAFGYTLLHISGIYTNSKKRCRYCRNRNGFYCKLLETHIKHPSKAGCKHFAKV